MASDFRYQCGGFPKGLAEKDILQEWSGYYFEKKKQNKKTVNFCCSILLAFIPHELLLTKHIWNFVKYFLKDNEM